MIWYYYIVILIMIPDLYLIKLLINNQHVLLSINIIVDNYFFCRISIYKSRIKQIKID